MSSNIPTMNREEKNNILIVCNRIHTFFIFFNSLYEKFMFLSGFTIPYIFSKLSLEINLKSHEHVLLISTFLFLFDYI